MRTEQQIKERVQLVIIEEIQATNLITQGEPENYIPRFVSNLTERINELVLDEIMMRRRI